MHVVRIESIALAGKGRMNTRKKDTTYILLIRIDYKSMHLANIIALQK